MARVNNAVAGEGIPAEEEGESIKELIEFFSCFDFPACRWSSFCT
jgi:hypothetical protein